MITNKMLESIFKVEKTCRACTKSELELVSLYDKQNPPDGLCYSDMIKECTMYSILEDDALPQLICLECIDKVRIAYHFKKQFEESQKKLMAMVVDSMKELNVEPVETIFYNCNEKSTQQHDDLKCSRRKSGRHSSTKRIETTESNLPTEHNRNNKFEQEPKRNKCSICSKQFIRLGHLKNHLNKFHKKHIISENESTDKVLVKCETTTEFYDEAISFVESAQKPESDTDDSRFDAGTDADEDTSKCTETQSFRSFKAESDIPDHKTNLVEITKAKQIQQTQENRDESAKPTKIKKPRNEKTDYPERRFQCETCSKSFKRNSHLKQHLLCHTKLKPYECPICNKKFGRTDNLKVHMSNHGKKQFECDICDRTFGQAYLLKRHKEQTHSEEKPFLCSECGQRFVRNGDLAVHMRRHKGEKPYKCQYCNKGFTRSTEVYVHERYHTGEKKHVCNICGKAFQRPYNLVVHVRTHTGERPYQCPHCPKNFAQCSDLKAHIRRHTGERYKCDKCSMGFIHVFVLNQHKRNVHGIDVPSRIIRIAKLNKESLNPPVVNESSPKTGG